MEYTISALARLAGVSTRTLRYYDEIGLLHPKDVTDAGYRVYGAQEVDMLQQILFYREMGVALEDIRQITMAPAYDRLKALETHLEELRNKRRQVDAMIVNVEKTIASEKGEKTMTDEEKFEGLKEKLIQDNEKKYGEELRSLYGCETIDRFNEKYKNMNRKEFDSMQMLETKIKETLEAALKTKDPASELAQKACDFHKQWLMCSWGKYTPEAHKGLAQMYVSDPRFTSYYEKIGPGCTAFLHDAIMIYCR